MGRILLFAALMAGIIAIGYHFGPQDAVFRSGFYGPPHHFPQAIGIVALGLLAAQSGDKGFYTVAGLFLVMMVAGAFLASRGTRLPEIVDGVAISVAVVGGLVALVNKTEHWIVLIIAVLAGIAHGYFVGGPGQGAALMYYVGFLLSSAGLILAGVVLSEFLGQIAKTGNARALMGAAIFGVGAHMLLLRYGLI